METLVKTLNDATKHYDEGKPVMSDKEWDDRYFELQHLEKTNGVILKDSPTNSINYQIINKLEKVTHNHEMLSLEKTKSLSDIENFIANHDYVVMCKIDGLTCSLKYLNGKLISAETRGNGVVGENIFHNALVINNIPKEIKYKGELIVDGEIICKYNDFTKFASIYKNPRNFASGSIRLLDSKECSSRKLSFIAWDLIKGCETNSFNERLKYLEALGFEVVPWICGIENNKAIEQLKEQAIQKSLPIDGMVFKFNDIRYGEYLGKTEHHFKNAIAYKFYDETFSTRLKCISWTMGRTGILTPVAIFDPVEIDGSTVERASLHNYSVMRNVLGDCAYVGEPLEVYKANQIIPQIFPVAEEYRHDYGFIISHGGTSANDEIEKCPICGAEVDLIKSDSGVLNFVCSNSSCDGKLINHLEHFCGKKGLDIKGLSKATFEKLLDWDWLKNISDIFELKQHRLEWINKEGFGEKSVDNILSSIENAKNTTLDKFVASLGIPLVGTRLSKELCKREYDYFSIREDIDKKYDFTVWEGIGPEISQSLLNFDYAEADNIWKMYLYDTLTNPLWISDKVEEKNNSLLKDTNIVITGKLNQYKNRSELQDVIEKLGGKVTNSITKNTTLLINNDINSSSSKNLSAKKNNIPILTELDFIKNYIDN